jgi:hypothetical protein
MWTQEDYILLYLPLGGGRAEKPIGFSVFACVQFPSRSFEDPEGDGSSKPNLSHGTSASRRRISFIEHLARPISLRAP